MVSQGKKFALLLWRTRLAYLISQAVRGLNLAVFAGAILALFLLHLSHTAGRALLSSGWAGLILRMLALAAAAAGSAAIARRLLLPDARVTRWIEAMRPELGSSVTGAGELLRQKAMEAEGKVFSRMHVSRTDERLRGLLASGRLFSVLPEVRNWIFGLPPLLLLAIMLALNPALMSDWRLLLAMAPAGPGPSQPPTAFSSKVPVLGDLAIRYVYPAYTGIPPRTESNRSGRIKCLKGTQVTLTGRSDQPLFSPDIRLRSGIHAAALIRSDTLSFSLEVLRSDYYLLSASDSLNKSRVLLQDTVLCSEDLPPEASLVSPSGALSVRKKEVLDLDFRATDDFGIKSVNLVFARAPDGREEKTRIMAGGSEKALSGDFRCDLAWFNLAEGEQGALFIEAVDNDGVSGGKNARSPPLFITVLDEGRAHAETEQKIKAFMDRMVYLLADHLEDGVAKERLRDRLQMKSALFDNKSFDLLQAARELLIAIESDQKTTDEIFSGVKSFTASFGDAVEERRKALLAIPGYQADETALAPLVRAESREMSELEDLLYFLTEAKEREKVENLLSGMDDLLFDEKQFEELLSDKNEDEKIRALREKLNAMQKELGEMFSQLMKDRHDSPLPDEFLNADALKNLPKDQIAEAMERIEKALDKGDADEALAEMLKLRDLLDQLQSGLNSAANQYYSESFQREMEMMEKGLKELDQLIDRQTRLNAEGDEALKEMEGKIREAMEKAEARKKEEMLRRFAALQEKLAQLAASTPEKAQRQARASAQDMQARTSSARERFTAGQQDQSARELKANRPSFGGMESSASFPGDTSTFAKGLAEAEKMNEELISLLESRKAPFDDMLEPGERSRLGQMANSQGSILEKLKAMEAGLKAGLEGMGTDGKPISDNFQGCKSGLGSSFNRMSEYNLPTAMPSAKSGLYYMMRLQESIKQGMGQMKQGQGRGGRMPYGSDLSRSRRQGGRTGLAEGDVEMENRMESENELKEMIKKAIKEKGPEEFEPENKKYYEKLGN